LAAILFTDIVGSTALRSELGEDAADDLRRAHEADLATAVDHHQGRIVKTLGDGVMAVFVGVADAVAAAEAAQQATVARRRPGRPDLAIRVGVSAGDVVEEDGDCHGTPVIEAARLCAEAEADQILCSAPVQWLSRGRGDHTFRPVGELALKGLPEPVPALEVVWTPAGRADTGSALPDVLVGDPRFPFVGRTAEQEVLRTAWKQVAADGARRVVLLAGEPGVGKTRLAGQVAQAAHDDGAPVLFGRCDEDLGVPFQPFVEALRQQVGLLEGDDLDGRLGEHPGELARLVPDIAVRWPAVGTPTTADPETERYRLFEAVTSWLGSAAADQGLVLVLDDLHWAGRPTLLLVRHLIRTPDPLRLLVIGTYRDTDLDRSHPLAEVLADLRREPGVERLALRGLDPDGVASFLEAAGGQALDAPGQVLAAAIAEETEGNPFFVGEVLSHLVESGALYVEDGRWTSNRTIEEMGIPEGVRDVIGRRLSRLSEVTNDVLTRSSVIGQVVELAVLVAVCDQEEDEVLDALEEAVGAGLVRESDEVFGYRFAHALVRTTLYEELPTVRRVRLHARVGEAIETVHAARLDDRAADLAHHFAEAAAGGGVERAIGYAQRAAEVAAGAAAHDEAAGWFRRALELHDAEHGDGDNTARVDLLTALGIAELAAGDPVYREHLLAAGAMAGRLGDAERMVAATLANTRGFYSEYGGVDEERVAALEAALAVVGEEDSVVRARLLIQLAAELTFSAPVERRAALADDAEAMARRLGDADTLRWVLGVGEACIHDPAALPERARKVEEIRAIAAGLDDTARLLAGFTALGLALEQGDGSQLRSLTEEGLRDARQMREPRWVWIAEIHRVAVHLVDGDLDGMLVAADEALAIGQACDQPEAFGTWLSHRAEGLVRLDRAEEAYDDLVAPLLVEGWQDREGVVDGRNLALFAADLLLDLGRTEEASVILDRAALDVGEVMRRNLPWSSHLIIWSRAAVPLGRTADLRALGGALGPLSGQMSVNPPGMPFGAVDLTLGRIASALGDHAVADAHFAAAQDLHERMASPTFLAEGWLAWGEAALAAGDAVAARPRLEQAVELATAHDLPRDLRLAREALAAMD